MKRETDTPKVGQEYDIPHSQGLGVVHEVERDSSGRWRRVFVEYAAGCMPVPPDDRPDAPEDEWNVPMGRAWIEREEWERWRCE